MKTQLMWWALLVCVLLLLCGGGWCERGEEVKWRSCGGWK